MIKLLEEIRSSENIKELFDYITEGIQILDSDLRYLYLNRACILQARESPENLIGKKITDIYKGIENTELYRRINESIKYQKKGEMINEFTYPDGKTGWFLLRFEPFRNGLIILSMDISELYKKDREIILLNKLLRSIRDINQLIVREKDRRRLIDSACRILTQSGLFKATLILLFKNENIEHYSISSDDKTILEYTDLIRDNKLPECIKKSRSANITMVIKEHTDLCARCPLFEKHRKGIRTIVLTISYGLRHFGTLYCVSENDNVTGDEEVSLLKEISGDIGYSFYNLDVEYNLGKSLKLFENFMENINDIMVVLNQDYVITYINPYINNFGFDSAELTGKPLTDLAIKEERELIINSLNKLRKGGHIEFEIHLINQSKKAHTFRTKGVLIDNSEDNSPIVLIMEDITEQQIMKQQMLSSQKLESIGRLAGGIAHDFNNILSVILNHADFAISNIKNNRDATENLQNIKSAGLRAADLTRQLLSFSRRNIAESKIININKSIQDIVKLIRKVIGENISIDTYLDEKLKPILIDPGHLDQILMNLIVNARDAMPRGGKITISTENIFLPEDYKNRKFNLKSGEYSIIIISDTGIGIDESILSKIFEPFFTTKEQGKGTGLGLATVYGLVRQYGGDIFVYSEVEHGSTFKVYLPVATSVSSEEIKEKIISSPTGNETILLVEDDSMVRDITLRILKDAGYKVLSASSPDEAIKIAETEKENIKLLLSDVIMPQMNGIELAQIIRNKIKDLKILFMSGYTEEVLSSTNIAKSSINIIQKPFDAYNLRKKIREILDK